MLEICPPETCTGCMACKASCAHGAIDVQLDALGFRHPVINQSACTDCGLCRIVCPTVNQPHLQETDKAYAIAAMDPGILDSTASGGVATLIATEWIKAGGVVYGCDGTDIKNIHHRRIDTISELDSIKGSKYVQSDISGIYSAIKLDLQTGLPVLLIGISCQIAGVRKYLLKTYPNLVTIDIICHGGASQQMLTQNVDYYCRKYSVSSLENVRFRKKIHPESGTTEIRYGFYFDANNRHVSNEGIQDAFTFGYGQNLLFRDSCFTCSYTQLSRVSDLTIGDFWGLGNDAGFKNYNGVSLALPHTPKGEQLIDSISGVSKIVLRTVEEAVKGNPQLMMPTIPGIQMQRFRQLYISKGFIVAINRLARNTRLKLRAHNLLSHIGLLPIVRRLRHLCRR